MCIRDSNEPWAPMLEYDNGLDDLYGILCISGNNNSVIANHISEIIHTPVSYTHLDVYKRQVLSGKKMTQKNQSFDSVGN